MAVTLRKSGDPLDTYRTKAYVSLKDSTIAGEWMPRTGRENMIEMFSAAEKLTGTEECNRHSFAYDTYNHMHGAYHYTWQGANGVTVSMYVVREYQP